jgi:hypothetical protein
VVAGKYDREDMKVDKVVSKANDSSLWKKLVQLWPNLTDMAWWIVGNGETISPCESCWPDKACNNVMW